MPIGIRGPEPGLERADDGFARYLRREEPAVEQDRVGPHERATPVAVARLVRTGEERGQVSRNRRFGRIRQAEFAEAGARAARRQIIGCDKRQETLA